MSRTRLARLGRRAAGWFAGLLAVGVLTALVDGADARGTPSDDEVRRGGQAYALYCAACHGMDGQGGAGPGVLRGPAIDDIPVALADLVIRTGSMPIVAREAGIIRDPQLDAGDRERIVAWMTDTFELEGGVPDVPDGDPGRGRLLFNEHCAACHSSTGWGGVAGRDVIPPGLRDLDRVALVSAARTGPFEMPVLPEAVVTDDELADIAAAVEHMAGERPSRLAFLDLNHAAGTLLSVLAVSILLGGVVVVSRLPRIDVADEEALDPQELDGPATDEEGP